MLDAKKENDFSRPIGRFIVAIWALPLIYDPIGAYLYGRIAKQAPWYWAEVGAFLYFQAVLLAGAILLGRWCRVDWPGLFGRPVQASDCPAIVKATLFTFISAYALALALFIPLSYAFPDFVQAWYLDRFFLIYWDEGGYPFLPNLLNFASVVIFAPIVEEVLFRGLLLHRWVRRYGMRLGIGLSSLLFALVHTDPPGVFVFSVVMSVLYLKTHSLWMTIACHSLYNFASWLWTLVDTLAMGPMHFLTIDELRSEWLYGLVAGVISLAWIAWYLLKARDVRPWTAPLLSADARVGR